MDMLSGLDTRGERQLDTAGAAGAVASDLECDPEAPCRRLGTRSWL